MMGSEREIEWAGTSLNDLRKFADSVKQDMGFYLVRFSFVTKFAEKIYVLHCFVKKSEKTSKPDIDLGRQRFKEVEKQIKARRKTR